MSKRSGSFPALAVQILAVLALLIPTAALVLSLFWRLWIWPLDCVSLQVDTGELSIQAISAPAWHWSGAAHSGKTFGDLQLGWSYRSDTSFRALGIALWPLALLGLIGAVVIIQRWLPWNARRIARWSLVALLAAIALVSMPVLLASGLWTLSIGGHKVSGQLLVPDSTNLIEGGRICLGVFRWRKGQSWSLDKQDTYALSWWFELEQSPAQRLVDPQRTLWVPVWVVTAAVGGTALLLWRQARRTFAPGLCRGCGYDLSGLGNGTKCPECGSLVERGVEVGSEVNTSQASP